MDNNWKVVTFDFDPDIYTACIELAQARDIPVFDETVPGQWGCPKCGNRWIETLEVSGDDKVQCLQCRHEYEID